MKNKLELSWRILSAVGFLIFVVGIFMLLVRPTFVLMPEDERFARITRPELLGFNQNLFEWIGAVFRSWGAFMIASGILIMGIAAKAYRRKEKWAWFTLAIGGVPTLTIFFANNVYLQGTLGIPLTGLLLVAYLLGLLLPVREFLKR